MNFADVKVTKKVCYTGSGHNKSYTVLNIDPLDGRVLLDGPNGMTHWAKDSNIWYNVIPYVPTPRPPPPIPEYVVIWSKGPNGPRAQIRLAEFPASQYELYRIDIIYNKEHTPG